MKVVDLMSVVSGCHFKLVGAKTGKTLASSWTNKDHYIASFYDLKVSALDTTIVTNIKSNVAYPALMIYIEAM